MKIVPNHNLYNNYPSFSSTTRTTYISNSEGVFVLPTYNRELNKTKSFSSCPDVRMIVSNTTSFFRKDIPWENIGKIFNSQFPKGDVNIYDFACSDGSEAFSLVIALMEQLGQKKAQRFFPIIASDVDSEIIDMVKSNKIMATDEDIEAINKRIKKGDIKKYFSVTRLGFNKNILTPKEILTKNVIFKNENINEGLKDVNQGENNIILCRNFWKYLKKEALSFASWELKSKVNDKTLVMIGDFDLKKGGHYPFFIDALGFDAFIDSEEHRNILKFKEEYLNKKHAQDYKTWQEYVASEYADYIPQYLK